MAERRFLLGTGAVVLGMGGALLTGTAAANAETDTSAADTADTSVADTSAAAQAPSPAPERRAAVRAGAAPAPSAATPPAEDPADALADADDIPAGADEDLAAAVGTDDDAPAPAPADDDGRDRPAAAAPIPAAPSSAAAVSAPPAAGPDLPDAVIPAEQPEPAPVVVTTSVSEGVIESAAHIAAAPAATASTTPAEAPVKALLDTVVGALGWGPAGGAVVATPALAAFTGQRASAAAAAVTGTSSVAAAAPPDPTAAANPLLPADANGVTGVQRGHSRLAVPGALIGNTVAADWYFPTQADGTVDAQGVIWLQHGFGATNTFYSALATDLAQRTNSIVVAPTLSSIPFPISGGCLTCAGSQQAAATAFLDPNRAALVDSAVAAGYTGDTGELLGAFVLAGHSAGGGFATAVASDYVNRGDDTQDADLVGVVMFDGVSNGAFDGSFAEQVAALAAADKPVYQIAAPAQAWNAFGVTTNVLAAQRPGDFIGVVMQDGSHVDAMLGVNPLFDFVLQLVTKRVPAGNTAGVYALSNGWINDMYAGATPEAPQFGLYAAANQQIVMGPTFAYGLPSVVANQMGIIDTVTYALINAVGGLFGFQFPARVDGGDNGLDPAAPVALVGNGVTGVRSGTSILDIPVGNDEFYAAPAAWYFPTQADGTIDANGIIWLQHGFLGFNDWYADMAQALAQETNSIVVAPNIFWFDTPLCPGCFLGGERIREGAATMFLDGRLQLNNSARATGLFSGTLPETFVLTGHSAGGNFATDVAARVTENAAVDDLLGVVMFDGVSRPPAFTEQLEKLIAAGKPNYQISAPAQRWNAWDIATETMATVYPDQFFGLQILNGSHTDVIAGTNLFAILGEIASALIVRPSPPGAKEAVRTLATGWVNDFYSGTFGPTNPGYGIYGNPNDGTYVANQTITMGQAYAGTLPTPPPVDVNQYAGTWYEQGSVPQFFSIGLVNTSATYTPQPDGSIKVENSGNYFFNNGPQSSITGSAVAVNAANTRLNVGFFFGEPGAEEPGNYWILDYATDYSWAIVSDPSLVSGYILTRDKIVTEEYYDDLLNRAKQLGISGPILRTRQFPAADPAATLPGPTEVPGTVTV